MEQASYLGNDLPPNIDSVFRENCKEYETDQIVNLKEEVKTHLLKMEHALSRNEFLDINTARKIARILAVLLKDYDQFPTELKALVVGATIYFIQDQDIEPDTSSILGLDDDVQVINYVLDKIGRSELKVSI